MNNILITDRFYKEAPRLRSFYEEQFINPRDTHQKRFVWDYWHVPDQYTLMRTPAYHYFPEKMYNPFHKYLVKWGQENLGCHNISAPWMSYYINGCHQNLHSDVPHGPWAFVFSLTPWKTRKWTGGETLILKPQVLDYWNHFVDESDREVSSFVDRIPAQFNRLTVFDPRFPHGVTEVKGTQDPLQARLVIHGWFVEPRPYVVGALTTQAVQNSLNEPLQELQDVLMKMGEFHGTMSFRLNIGASGKVAKVQILTNTIKALGGQPNAEASLMKVTKDIFKHTPFRKAKGSSQVTIPLLFK